MIETRKNGFMKRSAPFFIFLAGVLWGSMGLFVRKLNALGLASMDIVALRAMVTAIALFFYLFLFQRSLLKIRIRDIWCFLGTGICSIVFFNVCYFKAITLTSLSMAAVLLYTAPAIVMVLSYFLFGESMTKRKIFALVMTLCGCTLVTGVVGDWADFSALGVMAGLGAGFGYALYSIFSRYALERGYHSLTITFYTFFIAAFVSLFLCNTGQVMAVSCASGSMLAFCCAFGVLCTVVPYLLYTIGLKYVENSKASILASVEPVTASILGVCLFREHLSFSEIVGILLVLGAMVVCGKES
jgi:drug/metabolite transporter (DMT)-like permease